MARHQPASSYAELQKQIADLQQCLSGLTTESVVRMMCAKWYSSMGSPDKLRDEVGWLSPLRQTYYVLGVLFTTGEGEGSRDLTQNDWKDIAGRVRAIWDYYILLFHPHRTGVTLEGWPSLEVAFTAFTGYLGKPRIMGTIEQYCAKLEAYFAPFDEYLRAETRISATDFLTTYRVVVSSMQQKLNHLSEEMEIMMLARAQYKDIFDTAGAKAAAAFLDEFQRQNATRNIDSVEIFYSQSRLRLEDLRTYAPETAEPFWNLMSARRPIVVDYLHPTDPNPAETHPLFEYADGEALVPVANVLVSAAIQQFDGCLKSSPFRDRYLLSRDKMLEEQTANILRAILPDSAQLFERVFETSDGHFEHDILIEFEGIALAIECKASSLREPFREWEKAFPRIRDDFRSDKGIQKAYDQAERLRKLLLSGEDVLLFDERGRVVAEFAANAIREVLCICVTAEAWGVIATKLSLLLKKQPADPFPWAVNVLDLELLVDALLFRSWGWTEFIQFLGERRLLHEKVFTDDELDIAGIFINRGSLQALIDEAADKISVDSSMSKVFDKIWASKHTGSTVEFDERLTLTNLRDILEPKQPVMQRIDDEPIVRLRVGRNSPCPCGSGKKYKHCHYRS